MALSRLQKGHLFVVGELKQKAQPCLIRPQLGTVLSSSNLKRQIHSRTANIHAFQKRSLLSYFSIISELMGPWQVPQPVVGASLRPLGSEMAEIFWFLKLSELPLFQTHPGSQNKEMLYTANRGWDTQQVTGTLRAGLVMCCINCICQGLTTHQGRPYHCPCARRLARAP